MEREARKLERGKASSSSSESFPSLRHGVMCVCSRQGWTRGHIRIYIHLPSRAKLADKHVSLSPAVLLLFHRRDYITPTMIYLTKSRARSPSCLFFLSFLPSVLIYCSTLIPAVVGSVRLPGDSFDIILPLYRRSYSRCINTMLGLYRIRWWRQAR